jgi:hypothetical protein
VTRFSSSTFTIVFHRNEWRVLLFEEGRKREREKRGGRGKSVTP